MYTTRMYKRCIVTLLIAFFAVSIACPLGFAAETAIMVDPAKTIHSDIETPFEINITVSQVSDLAGWEFKLYYPNAMLNGTELAEGPFLKTAGPTLFLSKTFNDNYDATHGLVWVACSLMIAGPGAEGNGTLATITFKPKSIGTGVFQLADTDLLDSKFPDPQHLPHTTVDGVFRLGTSDVAVTGITTSKTGCLPMPTIGLTLSTRVNVAIENLGNFTETFNVTLEVSKLGIGGKSRIAMRLVSLTPGAKGSLSFAWNTTGFTYGNYTLDAVASILPDENNVTNNAYVDGWIVLTIPGDYNGDFEVGPADFALFASAYGSTPERPGWNPNCDVNDDNKVGPADFAQLSAHYGQHYP
jgi:hypothetical protein